MSEPVVNATHVAKAFGDRVVLKDLSLSVHRGERVGLIGRNGSGKSTLARILAGIEDADSGDIARRRDANIVYLSQHPDLEPGHSARDTALSGLTDWCGARKTYEALTAEIAGGALADATLAKKIEAQTAAGDELERHGGWDLLHRADAVLGHLGIRDPEADVGHMSGGEQRRVALARVLIGQPALAILDEPTNHLDLDTVDWLESHLIEEYRGALLLITHDRYILDRVATRTVEITEGRTYSYAGGYATFLEARAERAAIEERTEQNRKRYLRTELEWLRRQPKARTSKSQARIDRIEAAAARPTKQAESTSLLTASAVRTGHTILELHDFGLRMADRDLVKDLTLYLVKGERIGIVGPNGCGKTTLLRALCEDLEPSAGHIKRGANTRIAYLDQLRSGLDDEGTVFDNAIGDRGFVQVGDQRLGPRQYLERFLFDDRRQRDKVGTLSGGERARVVLAKLLAEPANLLILDEPTNDLDVETLEALENMILEFAGTAIIVTHDRYFLDRIATAVLAFEADGRVDRHEGNYSDYLRIRPPRAATAPPKKPAQDAASQPQAAAPSKPKRLSYKEERERQALPDRIEALEMRAAELERELADPDLYAQRGGEVAGLSAELERVRAEAEALVERWEELESRYEAAR